jgi:predicted Rossmann fold nucleotide-binding protein DprA/Smf involved in DNA uptake
MNLSQQAQAILLLVVSFGKNEPNSAKPLSKSEWARFAVWLKDHGLEPSGLLKGDVQSLLSGLRDKTISADRIHSLLERGTTLGLALEKWERSGLWVMTRSDPDYPERLKRHLRMESPAVLFGCGNKSLLNKGGIAVIGSRDASKDDLAYTQNIGKEVAFQGHSIVSGGARGVDQSAMSGALDNEGTAIGVMADSLLKATTSTSYRKKIMSDDLVLITPFNPEAGFNVGNAMARNRYIYCLADAAIVISSTVGQGGTWNGAIENLKAGWVPLWVKKTGNSVLASEGAKWLPDEFLLVEKLIGGSATSTLEPAEQPQLDNKEVHPEPIVIEKPNSVIRLDASNSETKSSKNLAVEENLEHWAIDLFQLFLIKVQKVTAESPMKVGEIASLLELEKTQANAWLNRGVVEGVVEKFWKPVRYQVAGNPLKQTSLF